MLTFRPSIIFRALYMAPPVLSIGLLIEAVRSPTSDTWLMLAIVLLVSALSVPRAWARVTLESDHLTLHMPLRRPRTVYLRQLISFERSERRWNTLLLRYHPMNEQGQLDIANQEILGLVPLAGQSALEERLQEVVGLPSCF